MTFFLLELSFISNSFRTVPKIWKVQICLLAKISVVDKKKMPLFLFPVSFLQGFHVNRCYNCHKMKKLYVSTCSLPVIYEPHDCGRTKQRKNKRKKPEEKKGRRKERNKQKKPTHTKKHSFL